MTDTKFPQAVIERLEYYVYLLKDPRTGRVFYVGKGNSNRVFHHANESLKSPEASDKLEKIRAIRSAGFEVVYEIVRHGLSEPEAFEVESALIDYIGLDGLTNKDAGHHAERRGRMTVPEIIAAYNVRKVKIKEPSLLIIVNRLKRNMSPEQIYKITRGNWVLGERRYKAQYCFAVYKGIVRQVYKIHSWRSVKARGKGQKAKDRWRFDGIVAKDMQRYVGRDVSGQLTLGAQNPVHYVNCETRRQNQTRKRQSTKRKQGANH